MLCCVFGCVVLCMDIRVEVGSAFNLNLSWLNVSTSIKSLQNFVRSLCPASCELPAINLCPGSIKIDVNIRLEFHAFAFVIFYIILHISGWGEWWYWHSGKMCYVSHRVAKFKQKFRWIMVPLLTLVTLEHSWNVLTHVYKKSINFFWLQRKLLFHVTKGCSKSPRLPEWPP